MEKNFSIAGWPILFALFSTFNQLINCQTNFHVNKSHLDYLYKDIVVNGREMGIIHIYSNAPDYTYIDDEDEGYACVDDAARAAIFYLDYYKTYRDTASLTKYYKLVEFLLYMQAENGFFYNFIWKDNTINKTFKTSVPEPNWWSWRALWPMLEGYDYITSFADDIAARVKESIKKSVKAIKSYLPEEKNEIIIEGIRIPGWLPAQSASDQAALLLILLSKYYKITGDHEILSYMTSLVQGIMIMQIKDQEYEYNGAFLSWQNIWHGWGNSQSYALLKAYPLLKDENIKSSALLELNNFYERLIKDGLLSSFSVRMNEGKYETIESNKFSQIAYIVRPMIFALLEAYKVTSDSSYAAKAGKLAQWFAGRNPANVNMYNQNTGMIFDGIENENIINKNSGAESTIEGLLSLLHISTNPIALKEFIAGN